MRESDPGLHTRSGLAFSPGEVQAHQGPAGHAPIIMACNYFLNFLLKSEETKPEPTCKTQLFMTRRAGGGAWGANQARRGQPVNFKVAQS